MSMKKIKLLHIITALGVGGAEKVVLDLASQTDKKQFDVFVVAIGTQKEMLPQFQASGVEPLVLNMHKTPRSFFSTLMKLKKFVQHQQIDLIHAHLFHGVLMAALVKMLGAKVKIVFTPHSINLESRIRECFLWLMRPLRSCDILFAKHMNTNFRTTNFRVIPNGIDTEQYGNRETKFPIFTFLAVGRFSPEKNFGALVELATQIPKRYTFQIFIAGEGPEWESIQKRIQKRSLEKRIQLLGMRKDVPQLCQQANAFLLPSLWEGLPIVLLEAGAAALPVIATDVGAIGDLIDSETGYLMEMDQFAKAMCEVMDDYKTAEAKGQALQQKVKNRFDLSIIIEQHQALYKKILLNE